MNLRELYEADLPALLNLDEMATPHEVEGKTIPVIEDTDALRENKASLGLAGAVLCFRASAAELPARKPPGETLRFDGRLYKIDDWSVDEGLATITLSWPTSY